MINDGDTVRLSTGEVGIVVDSFLVDREWGDYADLHCIVSIDGREVEVAEWTLTKVRD